MLTRREFLRRSLLLAAGTTVAACAPNQLITPTPSPAPTLATRTLAAPTSAPAPTMTRAAPPSSNDAYLTVARGTNPAAITAAAISALGGISRFVKSGDNVIIKPNICSAFLSPEYAATTNPEVVAALVTMCLQAGAQRVRVMDQPFSGTAVEAYKKSGIREAVERAGGQMEIMSDMKYAAANFGPLARNLKTCRVYQDILQANVLINVPIAKTHNLAIVTLAMKGLMGVVQNRAEFHLNINQRVADLSTLVRPTLTVIDGVRVLTAGGPTSSNLKNVVAANTVLASHDPIAADAYATKLFFQKKPEDIGYIKLGAEMGLGRIDVENLPVKQVTA